MRVSLVFLLLYIIFNAVKSGALHKNIFISSTLLLFLLSEK